MVLVSMWSLREKAHHGKSVDVPLDASVSDVLAQISTTIGLDQSALGLFFLGRRIPNGSKLSDCPSLGNHHKVYAMRVAQPVRPAHKPTAYDIDNARSSLHGVLSNAQQRALLVKITSNRDTIASLIGSTPGLKADRVVQSLLRDPLLLLSWLLSDNIGSLVMQHPSVIEACKQLLSTLHSEARGLFASGGPGPLYDDESDEEGGGAAQAAGGAGRGAARQPARANAPMITHQHLAAALAAVGQGIRRGQQPLFNPPQPRPQAPPNPPAANATPGVFTPEMLQRAMRQALFTNAAPAQQPAVPPAPVENFDAQLEQLSTMGFTDREENLRALRATAGNFEAALEFIINERESMGLD